MALYTAIDRMPETDASLAGTAVMQQPIPPTRVSAAAPVVVNVNQGPTVLTPAAAGFAQNFGDSVGRDTAPAKPSNKIGLYATAAGVVLAGAIAAKFFLSPGKSAADSTKLAAAAAAAAPAAATHDTNSAIQSGTGAAPAATGGSDTFARKIADSTSKSSVRSGGAVPVTKPLSDQLSDLLSAADDPDSSSIVLADVARLEPNATASDEVRLIATLRAKVAAAKGDNGKACEELKKVAKKVSPGDLGKLRARAVTYEGCRLE